MTDAFAMWTQHQQARAEMAMLDLWMEEEAYRQQEAGNYPPTREMLIDAGYADWQP